MNTRIIVPILVALLFFVDVSASADISPAEVDDNPAFVTLRERDELRIELGTAVESGSLLRTEGTLFFHGTTPYAHLEGSLLVETDTGISEAGSGGLGIRSLFGVSKPLDSRWSLGSRMRAEAVFNENPRAGFLLDIGIIRSIHSFKRSSVPVVGFSFLGIGKPTENDGNAYIPQGTVRYPISLGSSVQIQPQIEIGFPGFTDLAMNAEVGVILGEKFTLGIGESWSTKDGFSPLTFGMTYSFDNVDAGMKSDIIDSNSYYLGAVFNRRNLFADRKGPEIKVPDLDRAVLISPNFDGNQDYTSVVVSADDQSGVKALEVSIYAESGTVVRNFRLEPDPAGFATWQEIAAILQAPMGNSRLAGSFIWDGTTDGGIRMTEGEFGMEIRAWDDLGNSSVLRGATRFLLDAESPEVPLFEPKKALFGPGENDVTFELNGAYRAEESVTTVLEIQDIRGKTVAVLPEPTSENVLGWNRKASDGSIAGDGQYRLQIVSTDTAGNSSIHRSGWFHLRNEIPDVTLSLDREFWSPTIDPQGGKITLEINPLNGMESWEVRVVTEEGDTRSRWEGIDLPPPYFDLNEALNSGEDILFDVFATVAFLDGTVIERGPLSVDVDTAPPQITIGLDSTYLTPNGDGLDDRLLVYTDSYENAEWGIKITRNEGTHSERVFDRSFTGRLPFQIEWIPTDRNGAIPPSGEYEISISGIDAAGNVAATEQVFSLESNIYDYELTARERVFSPNGDGVKDRVTLIPVVRGMTEASDRNAFRYVIRDGNGTTIRRMEGRGVPEGDFLWDGKDGEGVYVKDGPYEISLELTDSGRVMTESPPVVVFVDSTSPLVEMNTSDSVISPDGDGRKDSATFRFRVEEDVQTTIRVLTIDGETELGEIAIGDISEATEGAFNWGGEDGRGSTVPDGSYLLMLEAVDKAGNRSRSEELEISVLTRPVMAAVGTVFESFSPDGNDIKEWNPISIILGSREDIGRWTVTVKDGDGMIVALWEGEDAPADQIVWEGVDRNGNVVPDGLYSAQLDVEYTYGPIASAGSSPFRVDTTPPDIDVLFEPKLFSPDGDGVDDTLTITFEAKDDSSLALWHIKLFDRNGELFHDIGGRGFPSGPIIWDGINSVGNRVVSTETYGYTVDLVDDLGNTSQLTGTLETDVLVDKRGEYYYIQVPSITFPPESAELETGDTSDTARKNDRILQRIVGILEKYPDYRIVVEGHAVSLSGAEQEETEELIPLSRERAEAVVRYLTGAGLSEDRMVAVGRGGRYPIVPHTDELNRWRNRRVDFILLR